MIASAQGQVAAILRCRGPAAGRQAGGGVQDPVAQGLGLGLGQGAVEGEQPQPGQQGRGGSCAGLPGGTGGDGRIPSSASVTTARS